MFEGHRKRILERERARLNGVRQKYEGEALDLWMDCEIPIRLLQRRVPIENIFFLDALVEEVSGC